MALSSDRITFHMPTANTAVYQIDGRKGKPRVCGLDIFFQGWDGIHAVVLPAYPDEAKNLCNAFLLSENVLFKSWNANIGKDSP